MRTKKTFYGLKQVPRVWFDRQLYMGFFCSTMDPSLYIWHSSQGIFLLFIYVDDMILTWDNPKCLDWFITHLSYTIAIKDLGRLHYFLGIKEHNFAGSLFLSQSKYAQ